MATGRKFYWMKLKESFMTSEIVDFFMSQPEGANYVVIYQMLCLKTLNTEGRLERKIGDIIIKYDIPKLQRDLKWFSADTIRVALELYKKFGLIYEEMDDVLVLSDYGNLVGSETDWKEQKRLQRERRRLEIPEEAETCSDECGHVHQNVHTEIRDKEIRDKEIRDIDNRDKEEKKAKEKKTDAFVELADGNDMLLDTLNEFSKMRTAIKKPLTDRAKTLLVNKLNRDFRKSEWIPVLEQSILNNWQTLYPLKDRAEIDTSEDLNDYLNELDRTEFEIIGVGIDD